MTRKSRAKPTSPFHCFNSSPEVIRLVVMMYVRFPLSLRNVEDGTVRLTCIPILDAAHIRSYADGGQHELSNGMLLRTDIHRLFDLGYVTVTDDRRFAVSERLKTDFDNGVHYYAMQGQRLASPAPGLAAPTPEALKWHRDNRYLV